MRKNVDNVDKEENNNKGKKVLGYNLQISKHIFGQSKRRNKTYRYLFNVDVAVAILVQFSLNLLTLEVFLSEIWIFFCSER